MGSLSSLTRSFIRLHEALFASTNLSSLPRSALRLHETLLALTLLTPSSLRLHSALTRSEEDFVFVVFVGLRVPADAGAGIEWGGRLQRRHFSEVVQHIAEQAEGGIVEKSAICVLSVFLWSRRLHDSLLIRGSVILI